ncbi:laccase domain protein [Halobacillus andaensis]|uniref:Purine nucleoside phosphorylase n=1 Tax=Halobacillus andaensis TaxID=1176239 RepID=A0A917B046_HALAA|nr:peptidoglycan editing factor PgeF [Halobacillus andaensis]MBP2003571.1 YfiH family protein [Halobacillus andaensis]GGF11642.1 laccase domain protein [Halobacillus andaensis]
MTEPFQRMTLKQLTCFDGFHVVAGITSREDGYSEVPFQSLNMGLHVSDQQDKVIKNRKALGNELNVPLEQWVMGEQVHGTEIKVVSEADKGKGAFKHEDALKGIDGIITNQKDILLTAFYADCVPLLFLEPKSGWIGVAHAGWKGTVHEMVRHMTERLEEQGAQRSNIRLVIGPCISQSHYEVDDRVIEHIAEVYKTQVLKKVNENKFNLDLKELNRQIAINAGILSDNIEVSNYCTYEEDQLFFSHRRDRGQTGRMLAYIGLKG